MADSSQNELVYMDISIGGKPPERVVFELFSSVAPRTCKNFRLLCRYALMIRLWALPVPNPLPAALTHTLCTRHATRDTRHARQWKEPEAVLVPQHHFPQDHSPVHVSGWGL